MGLDIYMELDILGCTRYYTVYLRQSEILEFRWIHPIHDLLNFWIQHWAGGKAWKRGYEPVVRAAANTPSYCPSQIDLMTAREVLWSEYPHSREELLLTKDIPNFRDGTWRDGTIPENART